MSDPAKQEASKSLMKLVSERVDREDGMIDMVRYSRQATAQVFSSEIVRVQAFMIEATKKKMALIEGMLEGMRVVQEKLFSPDTIKNANIQELLVVSCQICDRLIALSSSVADTYGLMKELNTKIPEYSAAQGFVKMAEDGKFTPEVRKRLKLAYELVTSAVKEITAGDKAVAPEAVTIEVESSTDNPREDAVES